MESTTKPRITIAIAPARALFLLGVLALVSPSLAGLSSAQSAADLKRKAEEAGVTSEEDALRKAKAAGMTRDQIRQALREAGYSEAAVQEILKGEPLDTAGGRGGVPSYTPPAPADSDLVAPSIGPPARAPLRPEDYPEFTKEISRRVPGTPPVLPFGY